MLRVFRYPCRTVPAVMLFATTSVRKQRDPYSPNSMSPETAQKVREEDRNDQERERKLRQQFQEKINAYQQQQSQHQHQEQPHQQSHQHASSNQSTWIPKPPRFGPFGSMPQPLPSDARVRMLRLTFFALTIYLLILLNRLRNPNSTMGLLRGLRWWQAPPDTVVVTAVLPYLASFRDQRVVKNEYEEDTTRYPYLSLATFLARRHPEVLGGHRTTQAELIAALTACFLASQDLKFLDAVNRAARQYPRDTKAAVDRTIEELRVDFPHVFAPVVPVAAVSYGMPPPLTPLHPSTFSGAALAPSQSSSYLSPSAPYSDANHNNAASTSEVSSHPVVWNMTDPASLSIGTLSPSSGNSGGGSV